MKKINILFTFVLGAFVAQAQSNEAPIQVQSKTLVDSTVMMVDAGNINESYTALHWNDKVYKLERATIEPLKIGSENEGLSALHVNNKVIRLNKLVATDSSKYCADHLKYLSVH